MEFKNFGECLAWMMESPENVAVRRGVYRYKWDSILLVSDRPDDGWTTSVDPVNELSRDTWSRAPREPLEFRWETDGRLTARYTAEGDGYTVSISVTIRSNPNPPQFELILKEKN